MPQAAHQQPVGMTVGIDELHDPQCLPARTTPGELKRQELKRRVIDGLKEHGTLTHAAAAAGISPSTIYRWREQDTTFNDQVTEFLNIDLIDTLVSSMFSIATSGDPKTANAAVKAGEVLLKAYDRPRFGDQIKQETTITNNQNVTHVIEFRDVMRAEQEAKVRAIRTRTLDMETTWPNDQK